MASSSGRSSKAGRIYQRRKAQEPINVKYILNGHQHRHHLRLVHTDLNTTHDDVGLLCFVKGERHKMAYNR